MIKLIMISLRIFILFLFFVLHIHAKEIHVLETNLYIPLLNKSEVFIDSQNHTLQEVGQQKFDSFNKEYINLALTTDTIWVKFSLKNNSQKTIDKLLVINNPLLIFIDIYMIHQDKTKHKQLQQKRATLSPTYSITLPANSTVDFTMHIKSYSSLKFGLYLCDLENYKEKDLHKQLINILFIGIIFTMMLYNFLLFFYIRDISYLFYSIYLFFIILLESSFIGLMPIYLPESYMAIDNSLLLGKINLLIIFYILYTISFLRIKKEDFVFKLSLFYITIAIITNLFTTLNYPFLLKISLINAILAIVTIFIQSVLSYEHGYKQARFFIAGFGVVSIAFILTILDAFGMISFIYQVQNILIIATAIEALLLSIAFVDSHKLLQESKLKKEHQLLEESQQREQLVNKEVDKKTDQLQHAMVMQDLLFNELHHRVKNNLQLILSITRLQKEQIQNPDFKEQFGSLENRINAIATTHNTIYLSKELEIISMRDYITKLTTGLKAGDIDNKIIFNYDIDLNMTLKKAINVGLIINELVSNALKHAFKDKGGEINIILKEGYLEISDNGSGYTHANKDEESLGMKLVNILVKDQLKGTLEITHTKGTKNIIRFKDA